MTPRLDYYATAPKLMGVMVQLERAVTAEGLEQALIELVKTRASQMNGCAYCIEMHGRDALAAGESPSRLLLLDAWREAPGYTERERAALAWTEALTRVAETRAPDADYDALRPHFTEEEIVRLTLLIATINVWNRIAVGFRSVPGTPPGGR